MKNTLLTIAVAVLALVVSSQPVSAHFDPNIDVPQLTRAADFIFKGQVISVAYRNSELVPLFDRNGNPVFDEDGNQAYADGSAIPHAFVTYQVEQVYKGPRMPPTEITLRIEGGESDNADPLEKRWLFIEPYPIFNVGDRDILFLEGNAQDPCPLANCQKGRFRIFEDLNVPGQHYIFSDMGFEIRAVIPDGGPVHEWPIVYGPQHIRPEVTTRMIGQEELELVLVNPTEGLIPPEDDNPQGIHFSESFFDTYLSDLVGELFTPEELLDLPPVDSADINQSFQGQALIETATPPIFPPNPCYPNPCETARPWLDELLTSEELDELLEAERQEREWLALSRGNPVLPQTPCERNILLYGTMPGDISGPGGKSDCRVNMYDFVVLAADWLQGEISCVECL